MKAARPYPIVTITPKGERAIVDGHPWVYEGEVVSVSGTPEDGSLVDVVSKKGSWLGCGFYNSASKIRVRLVTRNANDDPAGDAFWERRLRYAWDYRKTVMGETDSRCCRIIFGEADGFPGLTVDRFERVLVAQVLSLGMERIKERVLPLLVRILREDGQVIRGVYERNDAALRTLEGMAQGKGWLVLPGEAAPEGTAEDITENGIRYTVDFENGQKTGFFLDQKYNRAAAARIAPGKSVLDCFTHTGSFALNAASGGAARVTAADISADAIAMAGTHEALLQRFARERIPIMIGTQMITKGLNFENVTLVGVLNADQSLYVGDYRANERTFSLITQVIGRSGRGDAPGRAVIQTFTPANETIRQAARQDYDAFYRSEIRLRKLNGTPPFSEVLAVTVSGAQENAVVRCCAYIRDYFRQTIGERAEVLGPAPLPVVRMNNRYRYRVTLYCNQSKAVRRAAANIVMYCNTEKSFRDVTVFADDNPLD